MASRANWKGFLHLSLVTCPVALFPATSESEKVSYNQKNKNAGHRIKYAKVDAETAEEVPTTTSYKVDTDTYVTVDKEELDNIALEKPGPSTSTSSSRSPTSMNSTWCGRNTSCPKARSATTPSP
jgi:non-homologous end joining protein Ku